MFTGADRCLESAMNVALVFASSRHRLENSPRPPSPWTARHRHRGDLRSSSAQIGPSERLARTAFRLPTSSIGRRRPRPDLDSRDKRQRWCLVRGCSVRPVRSMNFPRGDLQEPSRRPVAGPASGALGGPRRRRPRHGPIWIRRSGSRRTSLGCTCGGSRSCSGNNSSTRLSPTATRRSTSLPTTCWRI